VIEVDVYYEPIQVGQVGSMLMVRDRRQAVALPGVNTTRDVTTAFTTLTTVGGWRFSARRKWCAACEVDGGSRIESGTGSRGDHKSAQGTSRIGPGALCACSQVSL